jgi:hypothetical protein
MEAPSTTMPRSSRAEDMPSGSESQDDRLRIAGIYGECRPVKREPCTETGPRSCRTGSLKNSGTTRHFSTRSPFVRPFAPAKLSRDRRTESLLLSRCSLRAARRSPTSKCRVEAWPAYNKDAFSRPFGDDDQSLRDGQRPHVLRHPDFDSRQLVPRTHKSHALLAVARNAVGGIVRPRWHVPIVHCGNIPSNRRRR